VNAVKAVSKVGKFNDIACSIISHLVMGIFMPKNSAVKLNVGSQKAEFVKYLLHKRKFIINE